MQKLEQLTILAGMLIDAGAKKEDAERLLKQAKENERRLREEAIPLLMFELGIRNIGLEDGTSIESSTEVYASVPAARKAEAFKWLDENDFSGIIKTQLEINFSRGDNELAKKWLQFLRSKDLDISMNESVHPQTLKAFIKEQIEAGTQIPLSLFGAMVVDTAKVKLPKGKKA